MTQFSLARRRHLAMSIFGRRTPAPSADLPTDTRDLGHGGVAAMALSASGGEPVEVAARTPGSDAQGSRLPTLDETELRAMWGDR